MCIGQCFRNIIIIHVTRHKHTCIHTHTHTHTQKGRLIETATLVLDFEGLTLHRALYWPGLELVREVSIYRVCLLICSWLDPPL